MYILGFVLLTLFSTGVLAAEDLVIALLGGNEAAMRTAYVEPYRKATGLNVTEFAYDGHTDRIAARIKSGKLDWDVMQIESRTLELGCRDGLFEKIDMKKIGNPADFLPGAITDCGIGNFAWSQALVYDPAKVKGAPASWADFWDLKKFPGRRGLRKSAKYTLEIALMADGVAPADVYKVLATKQGVDRAFHKLDQIVDNVVWWEAAQQPALFMEGKRIVMSSAYTLFIDEERKNGKDYKTVWNGSLYDFDSFAIPKSARHLEEAYKFVSYVNKPETQKAFVEYLTYGPSNKKALPMLPANIAANVPSSDANLKNAIKIDTQFWIRYGAELDKRFDKWAPEGLDREYEAPHKH